MSDDLNLKIDVDVATHGQDHAEALRREFERLNREILEGAKAIKAAYASLGSTLGRGRGRSTGGAGEARDARDASNAERDLYADLRKRFAFEKRMRSQRKSEESEAARQVRDEQRETERALREQLAFSSRIARQRAQAEADAERETRRELLETSRMRDRENKKALSDARALERAQQQAARNIARGAGQVRSGGTRAVVAGGAAAGVLAYGGKRALDALTRSGVDVDTAMSKNARLETGMSPDQARAKIAGVRETYKPLGRRLGLSVVELLTARSEALQAGVDQSIVDSVVESGSKYAILNDMKPSEVMESSGYGITALSAFGKVTAERVNKLFNLQQYLAANTSASRQGLASFVRRGLSAGAAAGFSDSDTLAYGAAGTSAGQDGESVARMLSSTTERIASAPTRAADIARKKHKTIADRLFLTLPKRLGFANWKDLKARFSADSAETMEQIYEGLSQIQDPRERLETSEQIFGKQFGAAHAGMAAGHLFKKMREAVQSKDAGNALDAGMSIQDGAFGQIMKQIGVTITELTNDLGLELKAYWADLRDWALRTPKAFKSFTEAFRSGLKGFVTGLGSPDGTMAGLLTRMFGDPSGFAVDASMVGAFAQGVGQGLRDVSSALVSFVRIFAGSNASPQELGRWTARLLGLSAALLVAAPAVAVLTGLGTAITGLVTACIGAWRLMKAAGLVGATGAGSAPKLPGGPGAAAAEGWLARFGRLLGIAAFAPTASLSKEDQNKLVGRLGAYAEDLEKQKKLTGGGWVDPPLRKPVEELRNSLDETVDALRDGAKLQRQSLDDADFRSFIHPANFSTGAAAIGDAIRGTAGRAGGLSGSVGAGLVGGRGTALGRSTPGGFIGGMSGMHRRGIMGGSFGGGGGTGVIDPNLPRDVAGRAQIAYDFFRSKGLSHEATAGILASMKQESNFTPNARGDGGRAHGLFQHHADRRAAIMAATGINMSTASFQDQLKGAWWEMTHGDAGAQRALRILQTPGISARDAGAAFVKNFERPAADERSSRGALAEGFARRFGNGAGGAGGGDVLGRMQALRSSGQVINEQCVALAKAAVGVGGSVTEWRKGVGAEAGTLKPGTPVATFLNRDGSPSSRYAGGGTGTMGAGTDHAGVFQSYIRDKNGNIVGMNIAEQYKGSGGVKSKAYMFGQGFGEKNGSNYHAILGQDGTALGGARNPMNQIAARAAAIKKNAFGGTSDLGLNQGGNSETNEFIGGAKGNTPLPPARPQGLGASTPLRSGAGVAGGHSAARGGNQIHAPISITAHGGDGDEVARKVQRHLQKVMERRTHDVDGYA